MGKRNINFYIGKPFQGREIFFRKIKKIGKERYSIYIFPAGASLLTMLSTSSSQGSNHTRQYIDLKLYFSRPDLYYSMNLFCNCTNVYQYVRNYRILTISIRNQISMPGFCSFFNYLLILYSDGIQVY